MKIKNARIYLVNGEGLRPILLRLETDSGLVGLGEAGIAYGSGRTAAAGMIKDLTERFVIGADAFDIQKLVSTMYDHSFWLRNPGAVASAGMSAIEQALWDIKARALGVPVYELFGGRVRSELETYANGWYFGSSSNEAVFKAAEATVKDGFQGLKMYPFGVVQSNGTLRHPSNRGSEDRGAIRDGLRMVKGVRDSIGPDVAIMLDLSGGLAISDTIHFCRAVQEYDISFIEEATDPGDNAALTQLQSHTTIPLATGERLCMRYGFRDLLESRTVGIIQPDIGITGGILEAHKIAAMAEAYSVKVQPHMCGSSVAAAVAMHFSASVPNFYVQEHFPYWDRVPGFVEVAVEPSEKMAVKGKLPVLDAPGYGVMLKEDAISRFVWATIGF